MAAIQETKAEKADREKFQAEQDVRTLREAHDIGKDESRMSRAKSMIQEQITALKEVDD